MPDHWQSTTLGEVCELRMGRTPPRKETRYWTEDLSRPFCTIADMTSRHICPNGEGVTAEAEREGMARRVAAGSLLMSFKLTIGRVAFASCDLFPNEAIVAISPDEQFATRDFLYLNLGVRDLTGASGQAAKGKTLNRKSLQAIDLHLPSLEEQGRIVDVVGSIDDMVAALEAQITTTRRLRGGVLAEMLGTPGPDWRTMSLGDVVSHVKRRVRVQPDREYPLLGVRLYGNGAQVRTVVSSGTFASKMLYRVQTGDFVYNRLWAQKGAFAVISQTLSGCFVTGEYPTFQTDGTTLDPQCLHLMMCQPSVWNQIERQVTGIGRNRWKAEEFLRQVVHIPPLPEQRRIVQVAGGMDEQVTALESQAEATRRIRAGVLSELLSGKRLLEESYDLAVDA